MKTENVGEVFYEVLDKIHQEYLPSKYPFFKKLAELPHEKLRSPTFLGELYLRYQSACHATRVMIYHIPHLDSPALRVRKLAFISDDDGLEDGDTHHYQLSRAFAHMGASFIIQDEEFGELDELKKFLDPTTSRFVSSVQNLYPTSLGPWCVIEAFADDWMRALMNSLSLCFPSIICEPYFSDCFSQEVELRHARESLKLTKEILSQSPNLLLETIDGAYIMAKELEEYWSGLERMLEEIS
jgi:hypothetical protein